MKINITGHNVKLNEDLKQYTHEKIVKYAPLVNEPATCDVVLSDEFGPKGGADKLVKITIELPNEKNPIHAEVYASDFFSAIDLVQNKIKRELVKYKDKIKIGSRKIK